MHAIWNILLDEDFIKACKHGVVVECPDGIFRCFYFGVFTYSADYPEKCTIPATAIATSCSLLSQESFLR
jgi:hypothetical protein